MLATCWRAGCSPCLLCSAKRRHDNATWIERSAMHGRMAWACSPDSARGSDTRAERHAGACVSTYAAGGGFSVAGYYIRIFARAHHPASERVLMRIITSMPPVPH